MRGNLCKRLYFDIGASIALCCASRNLAHDLHVLCSSFIFNDSNNPVVTSNIYKTSCVVEIQGNTDGTGLSKASIKCQGPGLPIKILGSDDLDPFSENFEGVEYTAGSGPSEAILTFNNVSGVVRSPRGVNMQTSSSCLAG